MGDSTLVEFYFQTGACKQSGLLFKTFHLHPIYESPMTVIETAFIPLPEPVKKNKTHGDLSYDFSSHGSPDTTYPGSSFSQSYLTANLYTTINNKYPVVFHFGTLQTTIPYVHNYLDVSLQFDQHQYGSDMADRYRKQYQERIRNGEKEDSSIYRSVVTDFNHSEALKNWLGSDRQMQELMSSSQIINSYSDHLRNVQNAQSLSQNGSSFASKDSGLTSSVHDIDSIKSMIQNPSVIQGLSSKNGGTDSSNMSSSKLLAAIKFIKTYKEKLNESKSLDKERDSLENRYDSLNKNLKSGKDSLEYDLRNNVKDIGDKYVDSSKSHKVDNWLLGIRQLGIGRSFISYSELSVKNLNIFGFNAEYCNRYYFAVAAGKTDFRYQDFLTASPVPKQYLLLARAGLGEKEGRHLYFTVYTGSKQASYYVNNQPASAKLSGVTFEGRLPVSKNIYFTGEIAKSTAPGYVLGSPSHTKIISLNDRNNEAYSLQMNGYFPKTDTRILAVYNRYGIYFQSFSIYNNNSTSSSWQFRLDQYLFKKKLIFSGSVRKNDFSNPFIVNSYKSSTMVYSLQSTLRIRKWPSLTIGYLPFSQLSILQGQLTINRFYTLLGTTNYVYRVKKMYMSSSIVYTQYFNSSNQQGFIYYNAQSWFFNQSLMLKNLTINGAATISRSAGYRLFSAGPFFQWSLSSLFSVGAGMKYNILNQMVQNIGYSGNMDCQVKKIGRLGLSFERGYIPSQNGLFFRNNWGRAVYTRNF